MTVEYNREMDILRIRFSREEIAESDEQESGLILDYNAAGRVVGIEMLEASQRIEKPLECVYQTV